MMRGARRRNRWIVRVSLFAGGVVGLSVFAHIEGTHPRVLPTALFVGAGVAIAGLLADSSGADPADWSPSIEYADTGFHQDAPLAGNVRLIENHLTSRDIDTLLQGRLVSMTDDRLSWLGLSRTDPEVSARLGPMLASVINGPPRKLSPDDIGECLRRIEELTT